MSAHRLYSDALRAVPMLPPDEQHALACRYAKGRDPRDARALVLANLRLVVTIAKSLGGTSRVDLMDLIQEGNAGLMVAIDRYDPARGLKLSAYASIWIRAYVLRHLMETVRLVRSTTTEDGRRQFFERTLPRDVSLDAPVAAGEDGGAKSALGDFFASDERLRPDTLAEERDELESLRRAVSRLEETLDARERVILRSRLLCESPRPLRQVGTKLALSGERVRQLERDVLGKLRALVEAPADEIRTAA
jgi:RNA polymerase sigma-32 factor